MNYLLFKNDEVQSVENRVLVNVSGARGCYIRDRHQLTTVGASVKAGLFGGKLGAATLCCVQDLDTDNPKYFFEASFDNQPPKRSNITLFVGVPRPQTVKKIIQLAVSYGVQNLEFLRMEKTIPSYCDSKIWELNSIQDEIWESLQQVGDCVAVNVSMNKDANYFARSKFAENFANFNKVIACDAEWSSPIISYLDQNIESEDNKTAIILGPEAGFSDRERNWLNDSVDVLKAGLGKRIFRLEHAVGCALAICTARSPI